MNEKKLLKWKVEKYLRIPILLTAMLAFMDLILFFVNVRAGVVMSVFVVIYLAVTLGIYFRSKPEIMNELIEFAFEQGQIQKQLLKDLSVPYVLTDIEGRILWSNAEFEKEVGKDKSGKKYITQAFPEISIDKFPEDGQKNRFSLQIDDKSFSVDMKKVCVKGLDIEEAGDESNTIIAIYFFDETELQKYVRENKDRRLVAGLIYIDNYEEALESIEEVRRSLLVALIDRKINKYMQSIDAICKKLEKDKFVVVFQQKYLSQLQAAKFTILDEVRAINIGNEMAVTLSISLGANADTYFQAYEYARIAMDLALGRGGDQAVIKDGERIIYYGGKTQLVEKGTRVKARVKAHALREIMETKDEVVIMGHKLPDVDSIGAALGIFRLAKTLNKKTHIVINEATMSIRPIMNNFIGNNAYDDDLFIDSEQAINMVDSNTLLVVVDVNRPSYTECKDLLMMTRSVVVLDHHRQTSETIENAILSYVEPYASSACEMVAEILQYIVDKPKLKPIEADAMYSGILVDTDNFVTKTGVRTFEAAAFLRRSGADVVRVRKMFRSDMDCYKIRAGVIRNAQVFMDEFAISTLASEGVDSPTVLAAQAANELLDIDGIRASFVLTKIKDTVFISARSIDDINVQVIMEKLGGGGHLNVAGAQLEGSPLNEAVYRLQSILEEMQAEGEL